MLGISGQFLILSIFEIKTVQFVFNLLGNFEVMINILNTPGIAH